MAKKWGGPACRQNGEKCTIVDLHEHCSSTELDENQQSSHVRDFPVNRLESCLSVGLM